jgi:hypothetical protein
VIKSKWPTPQGTTTGKIKKNKLTVQTGIKGHCVAASGDNTEFLFISHKSGAGAAHEAESLKKIKE